MLFPESERVVYARNPIVEVICQLRFPTILAIALDPPAALQTRIRDAYPLYERDTGIAPVPENVPAPFAEMIRSMPALRGAGVSPTHRFHSADRNRQVALTSEFLAVTESDYSEWPRMRAEVERARQALEAEYQPAFYERVGLRYRNRIDRQALGLDDQAWSELLRAEIAGLLGAGGEIADAVQKIANVTELRLENIGTVRVACGMDPGDPNAFLIDADFFRNERTESDRVGQLLDQFNHGAGNLFRWAIGDAVDRALRGGDA